MRLLADLTVVLHLGFILFVLLGGLLVAQRPRVMWLHLPAVAWAAWVEFAGWICPLTPLENWLRARSGGSVYGSSFVEHYVVPLIYPAALTRELQLALGAIVLLVNGAAYVWVYRRMRRR